jgi:hypothetical protein
MAAISLSIHTNTLELVLINIILAFHGMGESEQERRKKANDISCFLTDILFLISPRLTFLTFSPKKNLSCNYFKA